MLCGQIAPPPPAKNILNKTSFSTVSSASIIANMSYGSRMAQKRLVEGWPILISGGIWYHFWKFRQLSCKFTERIIWMDFNWYIFHDFSEIGVKLEIALMICTSLVYIFRDLLNWKKRCERFFSIEKVLYINVISP